MADEFDETTGLGEEVLPDLAAVPAEDATAAPGGVRSAFSWLIRWHPFLFLGLAAVLAGIAWHVYPRAEARAVTPAAYFYREGLDRLYRVLNPDLPLVAETPLDEALAARNALLNLFVFHRENLRAHPEFINPHLLLGEANRLLAEFNPALADKYYADALQAYTDADLWEFREDTPEDLARYWASNFLDREDDFPPDEDEEELAATRRSRRIDYIRFRKAEAEVHLGRSDQARPALEDLQSQVDAHRRENLRRAASTEPPAPEGGRRNFELGGDEYRRLDLLMARMYDGIGRRQLARSWYLRFLNASRSGRDHAFVLQRLADMAMEDGTLYRSVNPSLAMGHYGEAATLYADLVDSPAVTRDQLHAAIQGLADANSRLAELTPTGAMTGVDELGELGRTFRTWLEEFSGQPLPRRTLEIPRAVGDVLSRPEFILPTAYALPGAVAGSLAAMAGGGLVTPYEQRRRYHLLALENYDRLAVIHQGTEAGDRAAVQAAREAWFLGRKRETAARLERMIDPLASPDLLLAARQGLAAVALDRGDLRRARLLLLGGYAHPMPLWFTPSDADWRRLAVRLGNASQRAETPVLRRVWQVLSQEGRDIAAYAASGRRLSDEYVERLLRALNTLLRSPDFYRPEDFPANNRNRYLEYILDQPPDRLTEDDIVWRNRLLLEEALPYDLSQQASRDNYGFAPFPPAAELTPGGILESERLAGLLVALARAWAGRAEAAAIGGERLRMFMEAVAAYDAALERYGADPGVVLYELANCYEAMAEIREIQGNHLEALSLTAAAGRAYLDVSFRGRGAAREMDALLAAGDAFFRSGLLERTVESQLRFLERFGYASRPDSEAAMAVVRAENLLGRAYWFLNDIDNAMESFRRNIARRTPDRFKAMYYVGRVLMEQGSFRDEPALLGSLAKPLPDLDRNGDPVIESALQAFNYIRQSPDINPSARAWRWSTFDLAKLHYMFAERARLAAERDGAGGAGGEAAADAIEDREWLDRYDTARLHLTEALERYPLRRNGGVGISVRVEPEDYADVMAARFETEYYLANTLLVLADGRQDPALAALARAHLENLRNRGRYAEALFDTSLDRFQLNSAVIREEVEGGNWDRNVPLPRARLGDDEGPTHAPTMLRNMLINGMVLLANEYFAAGERAAEAAVAEAAGGPVAAGPDGAAIGYYQEAFRTYQDIYDRFGMLYGPQALVGMGDALSRLGSREDAGNHYRMARNMAEMLPPDTRPDGLLDIGPSFWGELAGERLQDLAGGYRVP
ncbi:MAG: hypothetical protein LIP77_05680 [Planctomycetes bacterium]|nr:hypothetical protein [Planctomycetota bacterium]